VKSCRPGILKRDGSRLAALQDSRALSGADKLKIGKVIGCRAEPVEDRSPYLDINAQVQGVGFYYF